MTEKQKLQVCNGYLLEFEQMARLLSCLAEKTTVRRIGRDVLAGETGLADRQIESLISIGSAMGLIQPMTQVLTDAGRLVCRYDVFMEAQGTLEWCHYMAAGNPRNLVWFEAFNRILPHESPMTVTEWTAWLRSRLSGRYSERSLTKHLRQEVRFVADAYLHRNFKKLGILHQASDERLYRRRGTSLVLEILAAMLYDLGTRRQSELQQVDALMTGDGAPGLLFGLEKAALREMIEHLHRNDWLRYESTHNLDQIRLHTHYTPQDFISAYYEKRPPQASGTEGMLIP